MTRYEELTRKMYSLNSAAWRAPYLMSLMWLKKKIELEKIRNRMPLKECMAQVPTDTLGIEYDAYLDSLEDES